jgi:hypothetical protein
MDGVMTDFSQTVDARSNQKVCSDLLNRAERFVDVALEVCTKATLFQILEKFD